MPCSKHVTNSVASKQHERLMTKPAAAFAEKTTQKQHESEYGTPTAFA
jgi:menaquinone-dependent protoporphyrinogen IX oxidase